MNGVQTPDVLSSPVLNCSELLGRCLGRRDLVEKVLGEFQSFFESQLQELDSAVAEVDFPKIQSLAHRLKGAALTISAIRLSECANRTEHHSRSQCVEELASCVQELRAEGVHLHSAIDNFRRGG